MQNPHSEPETGFFVRGDRRNGIDRLFLIGGLDRSNVPVLDDELDAVAHAGGAIILDLRHLDSVDPFGVRALHEMAQRAARGGWWLFIVNCRDRLRDAFERAGTSSLLSATDVSSVLASGDGKWTPISLPPLPGQRASRPLRLVGEGP